MLGGSFIEAKNTINDILELKDETVTTPLSFGDLLCFMYTSDTSRLIPFYDPNDTDLSHLESHITHLGSTCLLATYFGMDELQKKVRKRSL